MWKQGRDPELNGTQARCQCMLTNWKPQSTGPVAGHGPSGFADVRTRLPIQDRAGGDVIVTVVHEAVMRFRRQRRDHAALAQYRTRGTRNAGCCAVKGGTTDWDAFPREALSFDCSSRLPCRRTVPLDRRMNATYLIDRGRSVPA